MDSIEQRLRPHDAVLLVDVQNDFCPGGALPIDAGDQIIPVLNRWVDAASARGVKVFASRDWHPLEHVSFAAQGGPWPVHCVQDTRGAMFHPALHVPEATIKVTKGTRFDHDQNSAFDETGLAGQLHKDGIRRLWVGGLAEDVCVRATVLDARRAGFEVMLIEGGTRPVTPEGGARAHQEMIDAGAQVAAT